MSARNLLDLARSIPVLPAFGAVVLLFGKKIGEPKAGWSRTAIIVLLFVASLIVFFALCLLDHVRANVTQGFTWIQAGTSRPPRRPAVVDDHPLRHGYRHADPPLRDRTRRRALLAFFVYLNLFAASMLVSSMGSSFLMTFMGEGVAALISSRSGSSATPSSGGQEGLHHEPRR